MNFKIQSNSSVYDSLRTTVIKDRTTSEGKMECFANVENENLPMKILLVTGKCLRELCLNLSGSSVIINYKSHYLLALTRLTKDGVHLQQAPQKCNCSRYNLSFRGCYRPVSSLRPQMDCWVPPRREISAALAFLALRWMNMFQKAHTNEWPWAFIVSHVTHV